MQPTAVSRAIIEAVDKGEYHFREHSENDTIIFWGDGVITDGDIFIDKAFWVALGKARRWGGKRVHNEFGNECGWLIEWHRFIDALAEDKTPEQFFLSLEGNEV